MTPSPAALGRIASAGPMATIAAPSQSHGGTATAARSGGRGSRLRHSQSINALAASDPTMTMVTDAGDKPIRMNSGSAAALCTAQPSAGAVGHTRERAGITQRAIAAPTQVQISSAAAAQRMTLVVEGMGCGASEPFVRSNQAGNAQYPRDASDQNATVATKVGMQSVFCHERAKPVLDDLYQQAFEAMKYGGDGASASSSIYGCAA